MKNETVSIPVEGYSEERYHELKNRLAYYIAAALVIGWTAGVLLTATAVQRACGIHI